MKKNLISSLFLFIGTFVSAAETSSVSVTGVGVVKAKPDEGYITLEVASKAVIASDAVKENTKSMTNVFKVLDGKKITKDNIQTVGFNLSQTYKEVSQPDSNNAGKTVVSTVPDGYVVKNTIRITVCELDKFGEVLDVVAQSGVTKIQSISFGSSKMAEKLKEARALAVADALDKATTIAKGLGMKLGVAAKAYESPSNHLNSPYADMKSNAFRESNDVPLATGSLNFSVSVTISWDLVPDLTGKAGVKEN